MVNLGNAAVAVTEYTRNACFASPADFPATLANAALAVPTWWMLIITVSLYTLSLWHREPYLFLIGVSISLSQYLSNPLLQAAFSDAPPFPGCGGEYGNPNAIMQTLSLLVTVVLTFPYFYDMRRTSPWKMAILVGAYSFTVASLVVLHYANAAQLFTGAIVGTVEGIVVQLVIFFVFFPAIAYASHHITDYGQVHGLARWIGTPVAWLLMRLGYHNGLLDANVSWAEAYHMRPMDMRAPVHDARARKVVGEWEWLWSHELYRLVEGVMYDGVLLTPRQFEQRVRNTIIDQETQRAPAPAVPMGVQNQARPTGPPVNV